MQTRPTQIESVLAADIGTSLTKLALFDLVEGEQRFIAGSEQPTPLSYPTPPMAGATNDISTGLRNAIAEIERMTGRTLLMNGSQLIAPEQFDGSGVDTFVATTTATGPLRVGLISAHAGVQASTIAGLQGMDYVIVKTVLLDDPLLAKGDKLQDVVLVLNRSQLDVILIAVPPPANPKKSALHPQLLGIAQSLNVMEQNALSDHQRAVIWTGQPELHDELATSLGPGFQVIGVPNAFANIEPKYKKGAAKLPAGSEPLREELGTIWRDRLVSQLPGYAQMSTWLSAPVVTSGEATRNVVRFLATMRQTNVTLADLGSRATGVYMAGPKQDAASFLSEWGIGVGLDAFFDGQGGTNWVQEVMRWLPFEIGEEELRSILLNKHYSHWTVPQTVREQQIEVALARVILRQAIHHAGPAFNNPKPARSIDLLIGSGGPFGKLGQPQAMALLLLDAIQPVGVAQLAVDRFSLIPQLGATAQLYPQGAGEVALNAGQEMLGAVIAPAGKGQPGKDAVQLDIEYEDKRALKLNVPFGTLEVIALAPGEKATVTIRLIGGKLNAGWGRSKAKVQLTGGSVGLIVDARGRPLPLATVAAEARRQQQEWQQAIGIRMEEGK